MAETPAQLAERLKAMGAKPAASFVAPPEAPTSVSDPVGEPVKDPTFVPEITTEPAKIEDALKPPSSTVKAPTTTNTANTTTGKLPVKSGDDINPQMTNLIEEARKRNEALDKRFPDANVPQQLRTNSAKVLQILKDNGMDSQQAEKALKQLLSLE
jgi:hypothetical protein